MGKNVSKVIVYLANTKETTSRDIERGTDLRQPEVSMVMTALMELKWVESREDRPEYTVGQKSGHKGRPEKIYHLALPISEVVDSIEEDKKAELNNQLAMIRQLREFIAE